jgi:hypothetical protein
MYTSNDKDILQHNFAIWVSHSALIYKLTLQLYFKYVRGLISKIIQICDRKHFISIIYSIVLHRVK